MVLVIELPGKWAQKTKTNKLLFTLETGYLKQADIIEAIYQEGLGAVRVVNGLAAKAVVVPPSGSEKLKNNCSKDMVTFETPH